MPQTNHPQTDHELATVPEEGYQPHALRTTLRRIEAERRYNPHPFHKWLHGGMQRAFLTARIFKPGALNHAYVEPAHIPPGASRPEEWE